MIIMPLSVLVNKPVTDGNLYSVVIGGFTGSKSGKSITGATIASDKIYSISQGRVVDIGIDPISEMYAVTVAYRSDMWFRYCELSSVAVKKNQMLSLKDLVGIPNRGKMRFEYCTPEESRYIVRLCNTVMYKHDPLYILYGTEQLYMLDEAMSHYYDIVDK